MYDEDKFKKFTTVKWFYLNKKKEISRSQKLFAQLTTRELEKA